MAYTVHRGRTSPLFMRFQPNEKDAKNKFGDCTIRALCAVTGQTWAECFRKLVPFMAE